MEMIKAGTNEFNIRYTNVKVEELDEPVEVDVTSEQKKLEVDYSSDLAIKDRLNSIKNKYGEEGLQTVVDNIIVAKKILKENGIYKKIGSTRFNRIWRLWWNRSRKLDFAKWWFFCKSNANILRSNCR